jgi:hypothetical protein
MAWADYEPYVKPAIGLGIVSAGISAGRGIVSRRKRKAAPKRRRVVAKKRVITRKKTARRRTRR